MYHCLFFDSLFLLTIPEQLLTYWHLLKITNTCIIDILSPQNLASMLKTKCKMATHLIKMSRMSANYIFGEKENVIKSHLLLIFIFYWNWAQTYGTWWRIG